jgi:hypothetical protein
MSRLLDISMQRINTLNPKIIASATKVFDRCHKDKIPVYIVWGTRTLEQQDLLFRFGRSIPGQVQTTRRAGYSAHNYGLALDFCLLFSQDLMSWEDCYPRKYWRQKWLRAVRYFEEEGWTAKWRGNDFEPGHVENLMGNTVIDLYEQASTRTYGHTNI